MIQNNLLTPDKDAERHRALAKVYALLLKLAEENESAHLDQNKEEKEALEPLNNNIPPREEYNLP